MGRFAQGLAVERRVMSALIVRELLTRFGRENIGFLWMMVEPLLFAFMVGVMWRLMRGSEEHGIGIVAFVVSGYIPLVFFRSTVSRASGLFQANASLMYHRQITILDFIFARFAVEFIAHTMALVFAMTVLWAVGVFPAPHDYGFLILGWLYYSLFTFSVTLVLAPLSEVSEVVEKFLPVTTYLMIPLSGVFTLESWMAPKVRAVVLYSPPVSGMEMLRYGIFGDLVTPYYLLGYPLVFCLGLSMLGLALCRRVRQTMVVE